MDTINGVMTLTQYAETHKLDVRVLRRYARNTDGFAVKFGTTWAVASDTPVPVLPERGTRNVRDDGRIRYVVYMNDAERDAHIAVAGADAVIDVRERARARRAARKLADATE